MVRLKRHNPKKNSLGIAFDCIDLKKIKNVIDLLRIDRCVKKVSDFQGGNSKAKKHFKIFLKNKLDKYHELKNDPSLDFLSNMSPYLHFGQISPLYIALKVQGTESPGKNAYLEELIVRRELSINYIFNNPNYDNFNGLPAWSKETLRQHEKDQRDHIYSKSELENAETHDPYWNAAQNEMKLNGKMHGYMRMYWGKKIIEWSDSPQKAYRIALHLNDKYELDGRDANGYTGIAWCFGKHDHPWKERKIFGKIRYMSAEGLERKFNIEKYANKFS
jgi:deoxyribodipyrimidine photo-lyase